MSPVFCALPYPAVQLLCWMLENFSLQSLLSLHPRVSPSFWTWEFLGVIVSWLQLTQIISASFLGPNISWWKLNRDWEPSHSLSPEHPNYLPVLWVSSPACISYKSNSVRTILLTLYPHHIHSSPMWQTIWLQSHPTSPNSLAQWGLHVLFPHQCLSFENCHRIMSSPL